MSNHIENLVQAQDLQEENGRDEADYLSFRPGQRLKKARELRGMTVEQVGQELNLTPRYVQAMESDSYKDLPEPAFVRGYMRRYAQLVKLSPDDIAAKFDQCYAEDKETPAPDVRPHNPIQVLGSIARRPRLPARRVLAWSAVLLIVVLVVGVFWSGIASRLSLPAAGPVETTAQPVIVAPVPGAAAPAIPAEQAVPAPAPAAPGLNVLPAPSGPAVLPTPGAAAPATTTPASPAAAATDTLTITLNAESWVSVRDARQQQLANALTAPQTLTLKGEAPFSVNIGNAAAATLSINGRTIDLKPYTRGAVASLTVTR